MTTHLSLLLFIACLFLLLLVPSWYLAFLSLALIFTAFFIRVMLTHTKKQKKEIDLVTMKRKFREGIKQSVIRLEELEGIYAASSELNEGPHNQLLNLVFCDRSLVTELLDQMDNSKVDKLMLNERAALAKGLKKFDSDLASTVKNHEDRRLYLNRLNSVFVRNLLAVYNATLFKLDEP